MTQRPFIIELTTEYESIADDFFSIIPLERSAKTHAQFREALDSLDKQVTYSVAFVGQYSAGKSTIVSALTGKRDIQIDTNVATDVTASYRYKSLNIIDTPGLFTENKDHDERTYQAIEQADLIVFCLTHSLFDPVTLANFKRLAYERGYASRMLLVVNKMSAEAGDHEDKVNAYTHTLEQTLGKAQVDALKIVFIDAKDYIDGIDDGPDFLIEESNFDEFITNLDHFVKENGALGHAMTPFDILRSAVLDAQENLSRNSSEDDAYAQLLKKLSRRVGRAKARLDSEGTASAAKIKSAVIEQAPITWGELQEATSEEDANNAITRLERRVTEVTRELTEEFEASIKDIITRLQGDFAEVLSGDLSNTLFDDLDFDGVNVDAKNVRVKPHESVKAQFEAINKLAKQVGLKLESAGQGTRFSAQASKGFSKAGQASGSNIHQAILKAGKMIGFKFKPWQAINWAKNLANVGKAIGPILAVAGVGLTLLDIHKEGEHAKEITDARLSLSNDLISAGDDLKKQFIKQLIKTKHDLFDVIEGDIDTKRQDHYGTVSESRDDILKLRELHTRLDTLRDRLVARL